MLQFVGHTTSQLPEQIELDKEEFTIGRDAKCSLVLDSLVSPRMISRVHCILRKTQPASAAVLAGQRSMSRAASTRTSSRAQVAPLLVQPVARWMLLDQKSMNGVFVNDVKVQSTLLSHGDILTIGGLGQKIPVGTMFAQPEAEFIFRFVQQQSNAQEPDQATLPMAALGEEPEDSDRTQPQESFAPAPRAASAKRAQTIVEEPAEEEAAEEEPAEEEHKEPQSEADEADDGSKRGSDEGEPEDAAAAGGEPGEDDAPTQILPPEPSPTSSRAASGRSTLRKQDSSEMVDATLVQAEMEVFVTAPSVRRGRSSQAPTRNDSEAATQILPPDLPVPVAVRRRSSRGAAAAAPAAAAAAPIGLDLHAYRVAASIGATMNDIDSSFNPSLGHSDDDDADVLPHSSDVKAMELDRTLSSEATQVLPASSQAATQVLVESGDASSSSAAAAVASDAADGSISASLLGDLCGMGMATQTQVLPAFERVPSHLLAPPPSTGRAARKPSARSALYDDDESEDDAKPNGKGRRAPSSAASSSSVAAAHSSAAFASPSASASPGAARTPASSSKKKRGRDEDDEPIIIEELPSEAEDDAAANKRKKVDRKPSKHGAAAAASSSAAAAASVMESCPLCSESVPAARLEAHVNSCLRAAAVDADAEAARKLAKELEAADVADAAARKSPAKRKPAGRKPDWARDKELEDRARAARASGRRVLYDGMEDRDWEADYRGDHSGDDEPIDDGLEPYDAYRAEREEDDGFAFGEHPSDEEEERARAAAGFGSSRAAVGGRKGKYRVPPSAAAAAAAGGSPASKKKAAPSGPKTPCPLCSKSFFQSALAEHADICEGADEDCPKCNKPFLPSMVKAHARTCPGPDMMCALCEEMIGPRAYDAHIKRCIGRDSKACKLCNGLFPEAEIAQHEKRCVQKEADMSQDEKMAIEIQRGEQEHELVSDTNTRAIKWVAEQAKRLSEAAMGPLLARFKKLGHSERDLKATIRYIRNDAPLIIHVNLTNCMKFFVADTHYRNQFETKTSCGTLSTSARTQWEDGLFNRIYHHSDGYERVKYGVCNIVCDPNGVLACRGYGDSYMLLKSSTVRLRTSFASRDTGGGTAKLASCEWYAHVLQEYSDPELLDVISVATKAKLCVSSSRIANYKEVQYHGPVEFARDVESLFVHPRHTKERDIMQMCQEFARNNNCNLIVMEPDGM